MHLSLSDKAYIRDIKVRLEISLTRSHRVSFGSFDRIGDNYCQMFPALGRIKKINLQIDTDLKERCKAIRTQKTVELEDGWQFRWDRDCYDLRYLKSESQKYKNVGYYGIYGLGCCFKHYIDRRVHKLDLKTEDEIIAAFSEHHSFVKKVIETHQWEVLEESEAVAPNMPKSRRAGGDMRMSASLKR